MVLYRIRRCSFGKDFAGVQKEVGEIPQMAGKANRANNHLGLSPAWGPLRKGGGVCWGGFKRNPLSQEVLVRIGGDPST